MPFLSIPESLRSVDVQVGVRAIRGLLVLAAVVTAVLAGRWWWVQQGAEAVPVERVQVLETTAPGGTVEEGAPPGGEQAASEGARSNGAAANAGEPPAGMSPADAGPLTDAAPTGGGPMAAAGHQADLESTPGSIFVHVIGQVRRPGVVELPPGARVVDAIEAAGGYTDAADQSSVNLARGVLDGEQVWVAAPGEEPPPGPALAPVFPGGSADGTGAGATGTGGTGPGGTAQGGPGRVDLNRATQPELEALPGIGPVTAGRILAWRDEHGRFTTVEELMEVSGIGERTFAQLEPLVVAGD